MKIITLSGSAELVRKSFIKWLRTVETASLLSLSESTCKDSTVNWFSPRTNTKSKLQLRLKALWTVQITETFMHFMPTHIFTCEIRGMYKLCKIDKYYILTTLSSTRVGMCLQPHQTPKNTQPIILMALKTHTLLSIISDLHFSFFAFLKMKLCLNK